MPIGFTCKSVIIFPSFHINFTSRKLTKPLDQSGINVNIGWIRFIFSKNNFQDSSPCSHIWNMPSIYFHQMWGLSSTSDSKSFSKPATNRMEYRGANLVTIEVPRFCSKSYLRTGNSCVLKPYLPIQLKCRLSLLYFLCFLRVF